MHNNLKIISKLKLIHVFDAAVEVAQDEYRAIGHALPVAERDEWIEDRAGKLVKRFHSQLREENFR